ncbi:Transcriptional modulator of MazE/toxin, MazF [human gut metagenome]
MANIVVKRGEIFYADLSPVIGSEQGGIRPVIIIQNDIGNRYSPTVIVAAITSQINKAKLPIHVEISSEEYGLNRDSVVLLEQIRTLDKRRLKEKIGHMTEADMKKVNKALAISLNLSWVKNKKNFKGYIVYYITLCVTLKTLMKIKVYHKFK